jgi:ATPase subunit of ABC transporter with duplicated ATPase domains
VPIPEFIDIWYLDKESPPSERSAIDFVIDTVRDEKNRLEALEEQIMTEIGPDDPRLEAIYERLEKMDPSTFDKRAGELLFGLGFSQTMMKRSTCDMSGGWRMRVALAQALFVRPMLLVLDEPTNHLDLGACVWLEDYLAKWDSILLLTSHSASFLDGVCSKIYHLTVDNRLELYGGNYSSYVKTRTENEVNQQKKYEKEQDDIKVPSRARPTLRAAATAPPRPRPPRAVLTPTRDRLSAAAVSPPPCHRSTVSPPPPLLLLLLLLLRGGGQHLKEFISSCGTYSNLVKQAQSKQKIIDKMVEAGLTKKVVPDPKFRFTFPNSEKIPPPVLAFQNVSFAYSGKKQDYLYTGLEFGIDCDSCVRPALTADRLAASPSRDAPGHRRVCGMPAVSEARGQEARRWPAPASGDGLRPAKRPSGWRQPDAPWARGRRLFAGASRWSVPTARASRRCSS